jgi:hypothetical protein
MNQAPQHEPSRLDDAVAAMRRLPVPQRPPDRSVLEAISASEKSGFGRIPQKLLQRIKRVHPIVRYSIVATVLAAVALTGLGRRTDTLLLADVVTAMSKHKTFRFESKHEKLPVEVPGNPRELSDETKRQLGGGGRPNTQISYGTLDTMHARIEDSRGDLTIIDQAKGIMLRLDPREKTGVARKFPPVMKRSGFFEILDELMKDKATIATNEQLDGVPVVVYRLKKDKDHVNSTIWVDRATELPVRMVMENVGRNPQRVTMSNFVWDPPIADPVAFFSVDPPAGYHVETRNLFKTDPPEKKNEKK